MPLDEIPHKRPDPTSQTPLDPSQETSSPQVLPEVPPLVDASFGRQDYADLLRAEMGGRPQSIRPAGGGLPITQNQRPSETLQTTGQTPQAPLDSTCPTRPGSTQKKTYQRGLDELLRALEPRLSGFDHAAHFRRCYWGKSAPELPQSKVPMHARLWSERFMLWFLFWAPLVMLLRFFAAPYNLLRRKQLDFIVYGGASHSTSRQQSQSHQSANFRQSR